MNALTVQQASLQAVELDVPSLQAYHKAVKFRPAPMPLFRAQCPVVQVSNVTGLWIPERQEVCTQDRRRHRDLVVALVRLARCCKWTHQELLLLGHGKTPAVPSTCQ